MRALYQRRIRQWGPAVLFVTALLLLCGSVVWREKARARQAQANEALFRAVKQESESVEILSLAQDALARGADPNARMPSPDPPPNAWQSALAWFDRVRRHQPPPRPEMRMTALTYAAHNHDPISLKALLDRGAEVNAPSDDLPIILSYSPVPNAAGQLTLRPLYQSLLWDKDDDLLPARQRGPGGVTALMVAAGVAYDATETRLLLDRGADVNARDEDGDTALMNAAAACNFDTGTKPFDPETATLRLLLDRGADVNARDRWGRTALMLATGAGSPDGTRMLLAKGADATPKDVGGQTAYVRAAKFGQTKEFYALRRLGITH